MVVGLDLTKLDDAARDEIVAKVAAKLKDNVCVLCGKEFKDKEWLEAHFWDHTDEHFELECLICGSTFFRKEELTEHIQSHTPNVNSPPSPTSPVFKLSKCVL